MTKTATAIIREQSTTDAMPAQIPQPIAPLQDILLAAIDKGIDFQELLAAQKEMIAHQEERILAHALAAFQANCPVIEHNKKVMNKPPRQDTVRYTYADLDQIMRTIRPALGAQGLSVTWGTEEKDGTYSATAHVRCGGASVSATFKSAIDNDAYMTDQQKGASANKFAMRNAVIMALGLTSCGMDDDDGRAAGGPDRITEEQAANIRAILDELGSPENEDKLLKWQKVDAIENLNAAAYADVVAALERKR